MLRLEKLEIAGFKSFGDRTEIRFPEGITAVVGPNGCGKSNVGDAINWVLGEQSAKLLRGRQMADVIFGGSAARRALGRAEVSLIFGGADGLEQADQGRVSITRRLYRSGESEYELNGRRARLKDIQELLRLGKVGARTYATIEQGKIDQVLNAKPKERRALIEDAAGISGYKHKRRLAELKLDATAANLLRVNDVIAEVQRQIGSLKRQAAKARRYRRLREELRDKERLHFASRARRLDAELERLRQLEADARDAESQLAASVARLEAEAASRRHALDEAERALRAEAEAKHRLDLEIDREEAAVRSLRERVDDAVEREGQRTAEAEALGEQLRAATQRTADQRRELEQARATLATIDEKLTLDQHEVDRAETLRASLREELDRGRREQFEVVARAAEVRNRLGSVEEAVERATARKSKLEAERARTRDDWTRSRDHAAELARRMESHEANVQRMRAALGEAEHDLESARRTQAEEVEALAEARERSQSAAASLKTLEDVATRFAGDDDGVRELLGSAREGGIRTLGVVADYVEASRDVESAAEAYLQALLPTVIVEEDVDAERAAELLARKGAGRTRLICSSQPAGALAVGHASNGREAVPAELLEDRRVIGKLRDRLTMKSSANGLLGSRIGDALLVDRLATALELHRRHPGLDYLTSRGEVVYASGVISAGGDSRRGGGLLAHRRRADALRVEAATAAARVEELHRRVELGRSAVVRSEMVLRERRQALEETERGGVELKLRAERLGEASERSGRASAVLDEEIAGLEEELTTIREGLRGLLAERQRAEDVQRALEASLAGCQARIDEVERNLDAMREAASAARAEQAAARQRCAAAEERDATAAEAARDLRSRIEVLRAEASDAGRRAAEARAEIERTETSLTGHLREREACASGIAESEREIDERREQLEGIDRQLRGCRTELEQRREGTKQAEVARARADSDRGHLDALCLQELGVRAGELSGETDLPDEVDEEQLGVEIGELREKIERIGPVNLTAIEEFSELEERNEFLTAQRSDLERSMDSLRETIRRINRQSRQRFVEAFEAVRQSYQEVFKLLFRGGRADLRLEEGEDVLECGIEILAQPPGKRLTGVHLMSGGEKALSAIALLFAIFRYQPSPFCLLDEVDAALDDANVGRFARMVREYASNTQFVLITHNKLSMEQADLLYGVTMEEAGVSKVVSMQMQ